MLIRVLSSSEQRRRHHDLHLSQKGYKPPFDEQLYSLTEDEATFFNSQKGIDNDKELKDHILSIQAKAYEVYVRVISSQPLLTCICQRYGFPCIRNFGFTK
jgi:hypothetical protein